MTPFVTGRRRAVCGPGRRLRGLLASALLATCLPSGAQSLEAMARQAQAHDATYLAAMAQVKANEAKANQSSALGLPTVAVGASASQSQTQGRSATTHSQASLSASHPLYRPVNQATVAQGNVALGLAQAQRRNAEQDLMVRVSQAYFDLLTAQNQLAVVRSSKQAVSEQLAAAKRNFEVGTTTITDTREAQAQFDRISASEIAASNDLRIKRLALAQITGIADPQPVDLAAEATLPDPTQTSVNRYVEQALAQHPTMQLARGALQNAQLEADKAKGGELPTVDLKATHTTKAVSTGKALTSVSVELNWPVFTGGATQNKILEARALEDKAKADLDGAQRGVTQAVRNAYFGVQSGLGQVRALQAAEASSQSALDANKLGYDVGVRINIDVLNAQTALFQTKADLAKARYGVALGALKLQQAVGNLSLASLQKTLGGG